MNHQFSDIDKAIIAAWLFFGAAIGAFVSPLFRIGFFSGGGIGLFMGAGVAYVLFFEPWRRKYGIFPLPGDEEEETDISEFIHDSFEVEGIDVDAEVEFTPSERDPDEEDLQDEAEWIDEEDPEDETSIDLEEESDDETEGTDEELDLDEEYETEDESLDEDPEFDEIEEEDDDDDEPEEDEFQEQGALPAFHARDSQIHSSYEAEREPEGLKAMVTLTQFPMSMGILWLFVSGYLCSKYPELAQGIGKYFRISFFVLLPAFFLIGLSGLMGILFRERDETLEISTQENAAYMLNLLKILLGWGVGIYAFLANL